MKQSFNKGLFVGILSILIMSFAIISCIKQSPGISIKNNDAMILHSSKYVDIKASDIVTTPNYFKRKIEIIDRIKNITHYTFIITVQSTKNTNDIYSELKENTFQGFISIESDNIELLKYDYTKPGAINANQFAITKQPIVKAAAVPNTCKLSLVHGCVDQKIRKMNVFAYALCLYAGPECYAGLWAECSWIFCLTGNQNVSEL
jgi:hypothetical protein